MKDKREKGRCGGGADGRAGKVRWQVEAPAVHSSADAPRPPASLDAALKMGHCAPAVMAALIADGDPGRESAVMLASAMAGGIGNSGRECGALTSSILYLGDRYGQGAGPGGVPLSISLSRRLIDRFGEVHGGIHCDEIRKGGKNPLPCMRAMVSAPELVREVIMGRNARRRCVP
jgi:C_GCAxxG_C_C family probable redox protein